MSDQSPDEPLTTTGTIGIIVLDLNDNQPQFLSPHGLLIPSTLNIIPFVNNSPTPKSDSDFKRFSYSKPDITY